MLASRVFWLLVAIAAAITGWRFASGQVDPRRIGPAEEYVFDLVLDVRAAAGDFDIEIFVPRSDEDVTVRDERLSAGDLEFRLADAEGGRKLCASGDRAKLPAEIRYAARLGLRARIYDLPARLTWSDRDETATAALDSTRSIPVGHPEVLAELARLFPEARSAEGAPPASAAAWRESLAEAGIDVVEAVDRIHGACLTGIRPADFSGTTDALTALRLGEASCGGKSRLMTALCRQLGVPARMRGGLILGDRDRKRTSHVWVEVRLGDRWVPFDPLNAHRGRLPARYLPLYEGDLPLILHSRGLAFDYGFRGSLERVPRQWVLSPDDEAAVPVLPPIRRDQFSLILLAPFALLLTVFARQVVGFDSIGVFLPVLLGFCVTQVGWSLSGLLVTGTLALGVIVRLALLRMHVLHVPRAALLITFLVLLFLALTLSLERLGIDAPRGVLVLPLAALAMTVERLTVVALDRGPRDALVLLAQTLVLAVLSALVLMQPGFLVLTVTFPEILLVVIAEILVLGQYRGLRWKEWRRFRSVETSA